MAESPDAIPWPSCDCVSAAAVAGAATTAAAGAATTAAAFA